MKETNYHINDWEARIKNRDTTTDMDIALEEIEVAAILYSTPSFEETARILKRQGLGEILKRAFDSHYRPN